MQTAILHTARLMAALGHIKEKTMRQEIRNEVSAIEPVDAKEEQTKQDILGWIDSGVEFCRLEKPATPNKHLISYFVIVDFPYMLLVDHVNAQLWLPTGGHVEPGEHPRETVIREAAEELSLKSKFLQDKPIFLTCTETVGLTYGHTDVSLWYLLHGNRAENYIYDHSEFNSIRWFHVNELPYENTDPEMHRFVHKLEQILA